MAKGQQRGNREQKKPKQDKRKPASAEAGATDNGKTRVVFGKRGFAAPKR